MISPTASNPTPAQTQGLTASELSAEAHEIVEAAADEKLGTMPHGSLLAMSNGGPTNDYAGATLNPVSAAVRGRRRWAGCGLGAK